MVYVGLSACFVWCVHLSWRGALLCAELFYISLSAMFSSQGRFTPRLCVLSGGDMVTTLLALKFYIASTICSHLIKYFPENVL